MNLWIGVIKMVVIASLLFLALSILATVLAGTSQRLFFLVYPTPKWPAFLMLFVLWCVSMKAGYWWAFQRTFYDLGR